MKRNRKWLLLLLPLFALVVGSCEESLEKPLDKATVTLLAPGDSLVTSSKTLLFYWNTLDGATQYELQVVTPSFQAISQLAADTTVVNNQFSLMLSSGQYQWRVRAINSSTSTGYSATRTLIIQ